MTPGISLREEGRLNDMPLRENFIERVFACCPWARSAIQAGDFPIEVWVETVTSHENVRRAAEKLGCTVQVEEMGDEFKLTLTK